MRNYGITVSDVLSAITGNRNAIAFWSGYGNVSDGKRAEIVKDHTDNIRDLRIMLAEIRFPENTLPVSYGEGFSPYIIVSDSTETETETETETDSEMVAA